MNPLPEKLTEYYLNRQLQRTPFETEELMTTIEFVEKASLT